MDACLERARSGDRAAVVYLIETLRPRVEKMAAYYAHRCGEDADDLLQEAWLGLLEALPALDLRIGTPEQYLIKRAKWRLLDAVKRARLRRCASLEDEPLEIADAPSLDAAMSGAVVQEFLAQLKASQRAVLECLLDGLTWREAGRVLGCTSANVAYHVRQIRRQYENWSAGRGRRVAQEGYRV
jgi:RNA polymerase sigma factor (sigma-70 family)